jgi:hypothetical protein
LDAEHISQKVTLNQPDGKYKFFHLISYSVFRDERSGDCLNSEPPDCQDDEVIVLNNFGHPVCFCNTSQSVYPLHQSVRFMINERDKNKCFKLGEDRLCPEDNSLSLDEASDHLVSILKTFFFLLMRAKKRVSP